MQLCSTDFWGRQQTAVFIQLHMLDDVYSDSKSAHVLWKHHVRPRVQNFWLELSKRLVKNLAEGSNADIVVNSHQTDAAKQ